MTRLRSPSYPSIPLAEAIEFARKVHEKSRTSIVDREAAVKNMGYSGLTGRSLTIIAGVLQFSLLEKAGKGGVRVSRTAVDILHGLTDEIKKAALLKAGTSPPLYQELAERFPEGPPSENALRSYLIQRDFADAAIGLAISSYLETYRFLENANVINGDGPSESEAPEDASPAPDPEKPAVNQPTPTPAPAPAPAPNPQYAAIADALMGPTLNKINLNVQGDRVHVNAVLDLRGVIALEKKLASLKLLLEADPELESEDDQTEH